MKNIEPYNIVFVRPDKSFLSRFISFLSGDKYVHCFIVNGDGKAVDIDPRNKPNNVILKDLSSWDEKLLAVYRIHPYYLTDERKYKIEEFISTHRKARYDFFDCLLLCLNLPDDRDNHFNCQSYLKYLLKYIGLPYAEEPTSISELTESVYLYPKERRLF